MPKKNRGSSTALGGLADALLKAGVADERQVERAHNQKRRQNKELGAKGIAERRAHSDASYAQTQNDQAQASQAKARAELDTAGRERVLGLIQQHHEGGRGNRRFFFVARDGRVPFVDVNDGIRRRLEDGTAGIVESLGAVNGEHAVVTDGNALASLAEVDPELVRFWNRGQKRS